MSSLIYYLSEHPSIVNFRWSHIQSLGATWSFLFTSIALYLAAALLLHFILLRQTRPFPLGPIPAVYSLSISLISATIFSGILLSAAAEIRDTRWLWRRSRTTPFQYLLCFPLGTRPAGRVFFWSYVYYLSRFIHALRSFFAVLRRRKFPFFEIFNSSISIVMSFLWLEFSQSFQILAILMTSLAYAVLHGCRFWTAVGMPCAGFPSLVLNCRMALLGCHVACHVGVVCLHYIKGGCNGMGAWIFNSVLNGTFLILLFNFYAKKLYPRRRKGGATEEIVKDDDI